MKRRGAIGPVAAVLLVMFTACGVDAPEPGADAPPPAVASAPEIRCAPAPADADEAAPDSARIIEQTEISPELGVDLAAMTRCPSGVYVQDLEPGTGPVVDLDDRVRVRYTGWVFSGQVFDATEGDVSHVFPLRDLIQGWQEGIPGMRAEGKRRLVIPYPLAYGDEAQSEVIGPRADLIFDVEVVAVEEPAPTGGATTGN